MFVSARGTRVIDFMVHYSRFGPDEKKIAPIDFPDIFGLHPVDGPDCIRSIGLHPRFDPVNQECFGFFLGFGLIDFMVHYSRFGPDEKNIAPIDFPDTFLTPSGRWSGLHPGSIR